MNNTVRWTGVGMGVVLVSVILTACEWQAGGSAEGFSDRYNWVNFNGVYRGVNGGRLITDYTSTPGTDGLDQFRRETVATIGPGTNVYQGELRYKIIAKNSVTIQGPDGLMWRDDGNGVLVAQHAGGINGVINYITGTWRVEIADPVPSGKLTATYVWIGDGSQVGISRPGSGATGEIYTFHVVQEGENLTITDNNGAVYKGKFSGVRTTSAVSRDTPVSGGLPLAGDTVVAQFEASGVSAARREVRMVGTFQASVASVDENTGQVALSDRVIRGTWIEKAGKTGNIIGAAD